MTEPRQQALEALYEAEMVAREPQTGGLDAKAARIVAGVVGHRADIDRHIEAASEHWRLARMPVVDATILRIGTYELITGGAPVAVVINEAVELAKRFGTQDSGRFVNGLLSGVARRIADDGATAPA